MADAPFKLTVSGFAEARFWAPTHTKIIGLVCPNTKTVETDVSYHVERFHDIPVPCDPYVHPTHEHYERIFEYSQNILSSDKLLVHCHAGISRSTATAILVLIQHGMSVKDAIDHVYEVRPIMRPNPFILAIGDDILNLNGELVDTYAEWTRGKDEERASLPDTSGSLRLKGIDINEIF